MRTTFAGSCGGIEALPPPKAYISWSSGKDSAFALYEARRQGLADITGILTTVSEAYGRVAMHGVRDSVLERQIAALGLPALKVMLPQPCSNQDYEERMAAACERLKAQGVRHIVFGDLCFSRTSAPTGRSSWLPRAWRGSFRSGNGIPRASHAR